MNNKPITYEGKMKDSDNEFLYDKCVKQYHSIINYQSKMREYKSRIKKLEEENEKLKEENQHIFANVNDDELLRSNAMNWAEANELRQRIEQARNRLLTDISMIKEISKFRNISIEEIIQRLEYVGLILKGEENESR